MKHSLFLLLFVVNYAVGQKPHPFSPLNELLLNSQNDVLQGDLFGGFKNGYGDKNFKFRLEPETPSMSIALEGRLSHKTTNGSSIYIIPLDHMACSVPDGIADQKMLGIRKGNIVAEDPMPNGLPKVQIIPQTKVFKNPFAGKFRAK